MIHLKWDKPFATEHLQERTRDPRECGELVAEYAPKAPGPMHAFWDEMGAWHALGALDQETFTRAVEGPLAGKNVRLVGVVPPQVMWLYHEQHPGPLDAQEFRKWLARPENAAYRVPGRKV